MIERVAKALQDRLLVHGVIITDADILAKAAIEAMREPTDEMVKAVDWAETVGLTIPITNGWPRTVKVKQVGQLGVECTKDFWTIHHIPTLYNFNSAVPDGDWTEDQLLRWCWKVQQSKLDLWEKINISRIAFDANDLSWELGELKGFCLSTKVE